MEGPESKLTTTTTTNPLKSSGSAKNATMNGTKKTRQRRLKRYLPSKQLTLFAAGTHNHASRFPLPGSAEARKMTAISGRRLCDLYESFLPPRENPLGAFLRMLLDTSTWASTRCFLTWKARATPAGRLLFQLAPSTPRIAGIGSGLLLTPTANDAKTGTGTLSREINNRMLPTPTAQDYKRRGPNSIYSGQQTSNRSQKKSGRLNPRFVAQMMGYPTGWLD